MERIPTSSHQVETSIVTQVRLYLSLPSLYSSSFPYPFPHYVLFFPHPPHPTTVFPPSLAVFLSPPSLSPSSSLPRACSHNTSLAPPPPPIFVLFFLFLLLRFCAIYERRGCILSSRRLFFQCYQTHTVHVYTSTCMRIYGYNIP